MSSINLNGRGRVLQPTKTQPSPTREQLAVLGAIAKHPKGTRVTAKMVAFELGISWVAASKRLERMEKLGLVKRGAWEVV